MYNVYIRENVLRNTCYVMNIFIGPQRKDTLWYLIIPCEIWLHSIHYTGCTKKKRNIPKNSILRQNTPVLPLFKKARKWRPVGIFESPSTCMQGYSKGMDIPSLIKIGLP